MEVIVIRYIRDGIKRKLSKEAIHTSLCHDIYGFEIDTDLFASIIERLNKVAERYEIDGVNWNFQNTDYLLWEEKVDFDFIIENPPYLNYRDIEPTERTALRKNIDLVAWANSIIAMHFWKRAIAL